MKKLYNTIFTLLCACVLLQGCGGSDKGKAQEEKLNILCDEACFKLMQKPIADYDTINSVLQLSVTPARAFDCVANLMSGKYKVIILSRGFSKYEDSLREAYKVKPYFTMKIAFDALVFYTNADTDIDTLTDAQLKSVFAQGKSLTSYYPSSGINEFVTNGQLSSEYYNFKELILDGNSPKIKLKQFETSDSVVAYVESHKNAMGIGYFSQVIGNEKVHPLSISFIDSTDTYIFPHNVHQANILRGLYPYKIAHSVYLFDENDDTSLGFARYISKAGQAQKYFNDFGIVPAFARITLTLEE